jgi:hypothetical protein
MMVARLGQHTGSVRKAFSKERPFAMSLASTAGILLTVAAGWSSVRMSRMLGLVVADRRRCCSGDPHAAARRSDKSKQATSLRVTADKHTIPLSPLAEPRDVYERAAVAGRAHSAF